MPTHVEKLCGEVKQYLQGMSKLHTVDDGVVETLLDREQDTETRELAGTLHCI